MTKRETEDDPVTFRSAFQDLESEINDLRNMAEIAAQLSDDRTSKNLAIFAACHTAILADALLDRWNRLHDEAFRQKNTA